MGKPYFKGIKVHFNLDLIKVEMKNHITSKDQLDVVFLDFYEIVLLIRSLNYEISNYY